MNILKLTLLSLLLLTGPVLRADPPAVAPAAAQLPSADPLAEALPILQTRYIGFAELHVKTGDQLKDLVARSDGGIRLLDQQEKPTPIISILLPGNIGYWRIASFTPEKAWDDLAAQLEQWTRQDFQGIILDLRNTAGPDDFAEYSGAYQTAIFFAHEQTSPFSMNGQISIVPVVSFHPAHSFRGPIVVLINHKTGGAAEALAGFLKSEGALIIGQPTGGNGSVFDHKMLSTGQILDYEVMTVVLHDGTLLWNRPVTPDISVTVDDYTEKAALTLIRDNQILDVIEESPQRHRLSEASLVQGQDPEWDDYLASLERKPVLLSLPVIHDVVLIRALDSLKAIRLSERSLPPQSRADASPQSSASLQ
jgi:hypothetical protein